MTSTHRNSIGRKMIICIIAFALAIIVAVSTLVCFAFVIFSERHYQEDAFDYARIAAHVIRGDNVREYIETGQTDLYFVNTGRFLEAFREEVELLDISVFYPDGDEIVYLWDAVESGDPYPLGTRSPVSARYREMIQKVYGKGPLISLLSDKDWKGEITVNAYAPLYDSKGETVAIVTVVRHDLKLGTVVAQFILGIVLTTAVVSAVILMIVYALIRKNILRPLGILTRSANEMVDSLERAEPISIDIKTNDEFEILAEAFTKMDLDLREYVGELAAVTAERERASAELDVAAQIQRDMLPLLQPLSEREEFDLFASMTPARQVGGDFYDFFLIDDKHLALVMADVSGKGVPASLFMIVSKVLLKNSIKEGLSPAEALRAVNARLLENNEAGFFVTVWIAVIDLETGKGVVSNAGHEHPALKRSGGKYELVKYRHSPAVSTLSGIQFEQHEFVLEPGDSLFVYTDGVTEAANEKNRLFGEEHLIAALNAHRNDPPEELLPAVKNAIDDFVGTAPQFDDITMLAFRYNGKK